MIDLPANKYKHAVTSQGFSDWNIGGSLPLNFPDSYIFDTNTKFYICSAPAGVRLGRCFVNSFSVWYSGLIDDNNQLHYLYGLSRKLSPMLNMTCSCSCYSWGI